MGGPYHAGEIAVQERAGEAGQAARIARSIRSDVPPPLARFLPAQRWIVLGATDRQGSVWATALPGAAGFARATGDHRVRVDALPGPGDPLAGLDDGPAALLAIDLGRRMRARLNGRLSVRDGGFDLTTEQVYSNCMKYIQRRPLLPDAPGSPAPGAAARTGSPRAGTAPGPEDLALLERADTFFIATTDGASGTDVSHRGGPPGFLAPATGSGASGDLEFPDYAGNAMYNTLGNLEVDPRAGLLVPDFATGALLHLSGTARVGPDVPPALRRPGALRTVRFTPRQVVARPGALPLRFGEVEYSPFLPGR